MLSRLRWRVDENPRSSARLLRPASGEVVPLPTAYRTRALPFKLRSAPCWCVEAVTMGAPWLSLRTVIKTPQTVGDMLVALHRVFTRTIQREDRLWAQVIIDRTLQKAKPWLTQLLVENQLRVVDLLGNNVDWDCIRFEECEDTGVVYAQPVLSAVPDDDDDDDDDD